MVMSNCEHDKVYEPLMLLSIPPKQRWICRKCGEEGIDTAGVPTTFADEYTYIKKKFEDLNR